MRSVRLLGVIGLVILATECGGDSPTRPSEPPATRVEVAGPVALLTSTSTSYTVRATLADGTTRTVLSAWTSSDPTIATIDANGRLEGRAHGSATITASYPGGSASKVVRVVNNYAGTWVGSYVIRACSDTGQLTDHDGGWCAAGPGRVGAGAIGLLLTLVQGGSDLTEITGTLGSYPETLTGSVMADGKLTVSGTLITRDFDDASIVLWTVQLSAWQTTLSGRDDMTGSWSEDLNSLTWRVGTAHTDNELVTMHRTANAPAATH
jgi:hypothetical protein